MLIQPQYVAWGESVDVSCTSTVIWTVVNPLVITMPNSLSGCTSDCSHVNECNVITENCTCDTKPPVDNGQCPTGTTSIYYTVKEVTTEMSGEWNCRFSNGHPEAYSNLRVYTGI